jgi:hypothetical protein
MPSNFCFARFRRNPTQRQGANAVFSPEGAIAQDSRTPAQAVGTPAGDLACEPLRRKPRAIAISPAPNGWCYTAGIHHLLEPRRSVTVGLNQIAQPLALIGSRYL